MRKCLIVLALALSGCGEPPAWQKPYMTRPSEWSAEDQAEAVAGRPPAACAIYQRGYFTEASNPWRQIPLAKADFAALEKAMRSTGMSSRDIELIRARNGSFGVGQTFQGLVCSLGYLPAVNEAYYQGVGHQWQAILGGDAGYVYLEGDGTAQGMHITGWN